MTSIWGTRRTTGAARKNPFAGRGLTAGHRNAAAELTIPTHFRCPISLDLMKDPVTLPTGITYDRRSIETWLDAGNRTCPVTKQAVTGSVPEELLIPNHAIRKMIQDWCVAHRSHGVERIPTPRIPVTPAQVRDVLSEVTASSRRRDDVTCRDLVARLRSTCRQSERNRRCVAANGAGGALAAAFEAFAGTGTGGGVLEEILSALAGIFPLDGDARSRLRSPASVHSIVKILRCGDLAGRVNAVLVVKELVNKTGEEEEEEEITEFTDGGLVEALVELIKKPISPQATKASLVAIFYMVSNNNNNERIASRFVEMGLVPLLLEVLVDAEKSTCEKALGVLDGLCGSERGREEAYGHALAVPVLVKKMFRVSDVATEFAVSVLWKLCKNYRREERERRVLGCLVESLQSGVFQKLLLLMQVGCSEKTKEKTSDLLRMLNVASRGRLECIESVDLKGLKRPF